MRYEVSKTVTMMGAVLALLVAGCGGGGGSANTAAIVPTGAPVATPTPVATPNVAIAMQIAQSAESAVRVIESKRRAAVRSASPQYVSTSTLGVKVVVYAHGSSTVLATLVYDVSSGSGICTSGSPRTCTLAMYLQPGSYDFSMTLYDQAPVSGAIPGTAKALSTGSLSNQIIAAYTNNSLSFVVDGIVSSMTPTSTFASVPADGSAHTTAISFVAADGDGNAITGSQPYASPITVSLTESGGSGHSYLTANGTNVGTSTTITGPGTSLAVYYDGGGSPGYTTQTQLTSAYASTQSVRVSPMYVSTTSVAATDAGQTSNLTISEAGAPTTSYSTSGWSCSGFSAGLSNGSNGSGTLSVTSPSAVAGATLSSSYLCSNMTLKDAYGTSRTVAVSASIPTTAICSSSSSNIYLGVKSGASYEVGSGSPCALNIGAASLTIYAPPNSASYPASALSSVAETNDARSPNVSHNCGGVASVSNSLSAGASFTSSMTGNVSATSTYAIGSCSITIADNNGQSQAIPLSALAPITVLQASPVSVSATSSCHLQAGSVVCVPRTTTVSFGTLPSTVSTNALTLNLSYQDTADANGQVTPVPVVCLHDNTSSTYYLIGSSMQYSSFPVTVTLPNATDSWSVIVGVTTQTPNDLGGTGTLAWWGSVYSATSGSGTASLSVTSSC